MSNNIYYVKLNVILNVDKLYQFLAVSNFISPIDMCSRVKFGFSDLCES